jgi:hypothetical protein
MEVKVDPQKRTSFTFGDTSTYRSSDGGTTWTAIKGARGGDDYHRIWINPDNPRHHDHSGRSGRHDP